MSLSDIWPFVFWPLILALSFVDNAVEHRGDWSTASKRWFANFALGLTNSALAALVPISAVLAAQYSAAHHFGLGHWMQFPFWIAIIAWILAHSLMIYGVHRVSHMVPAIWRLHSIHHNDPIIDSSTAVRHHPLELLFNLSAFAALALVMGIDAIIVAGVAIIELVFAIASHSSLRLPAAWEKSLSWIFVTPGLHRIHHSAYEPETNSNYGNSIIIWDRLFGTYRPARLLAEKTTRYGLDEVSPEQARDFGGMLIAPILAWFKAK